VNESVVGYADNERLLAEQPRNGPARQPRLAFNGDLRALVVSVL
jgi:hypothetical protein|tara:strand:+ start:169 stop:300 length:132 start_codon:yes stop_codon:yes gene_type:complete